MAVSEIERSQGGGTVTGLTRLRSMTTRRRIILGSLCALAWIVGARDVSAQALLVDFASETDAPLSLYLDQGTVLRSFPISLAWNGDVLYEFFLLAPQPQQSVLADAGPRLVDRLVVHQYAARENQRPSPRSRLGQPCCNDPLVESPGLPLGIQEPEPGWGAAVAASGGCSTPSSTRSRIRSRLRSVSACRSSSGVASRRTH